MPIVIYTCDFWVAFDILNKSGDTLTVKELSLLFGKEETADAMVMENFIQKIVKDHNDQTEVSFDEFKLLVSKNTEFRGIQTAFEVSENWRVFCLTVNPYPWIFGTITERIFWKKIQNGRWWRHS